MAYMTQTNTALPDPDYDADFYHDVLSKRLFAWGVDVVLISMIVALFTILGLLIPLFFLPFLYFCVSFVYRWFTIAAGSATPGMRLMAIQLRGRDGQRLDSMAALLHTLGYAVSVVTFPLQLVSVVMMLTTPRRQGLTDTVLGTAMINRAAR